MNEFTLTPPPPDPNDELKVGPIEAESAAEVLARLERRDRARWQEVREPLPESDSAEPYRETATFTLRQMFLVITALSVWLGILRGLTALRMPVLAGFTGIAALVVMFWISAQDDQPRVLRVIWWGMLLVYVTCSLATWLSG